MEEQVKKLNLWNIVGLGVGGAIGTGIFIMLGFGIAFTGRSIAIVCVIDAFFILLSCWYNLAMSSMFVMRAGDYGMKAMTFGPVMTGVSAWQSLVTGFSVGAYFIAITDYIAILVPVVGEYKMITQIILIILFFATTIRGSRFVTLLQNLVTILLVIALSSFILFGVFKVNPVEFFSSTNPDGPFFLNGISGVGSALSIMAFAVMGSTYAPCSMAAVTKNPKRTIPLAIFLITCVLALTYGLMGYVAGGVLPYEQIAGQNISVTAEVIFPKPLFLFFVVGGGIGAIASSIMGSLAVMRYPLLQVANDGWLPSIFKKTSPNGYPYVIYGLFLLVNLIPIVTGMSLDAVASISMIPMMIMSAYMNFSCMLLPRKFPEQWEKRSLKIPNWIWNLCSILGVFSALYVVYNLFIQLSARDMIICLILLAVMIGVSVLRLKQGAVNREMLMKQKEEIIMQAITDDM